MNNLLNVWPPAIYKPKRLSGMHRRPHRRCQLAARAWVPKANTP